MYFYIGMHCRYNVFKMLREFFLQDLENSQLKSLQIYHFKFQNLAKGANEFTRR
jgi:hypothetical protein